ncbi:Hypothetical protein EUBELI_20568 (plasmid) [Lachnospira eligens ATCC 27750]|uniref:Uncharacterized protein n=1 Tax=Lachnospira eligens (strain ATCC 27750 / DSM 3376 / VPI C15-48 / C15-B4) TaxID=515620 RepID=C4Z6X0_LACE2|nr:Hypothetical protein EUBELI_20568 [[Eubacterium] eligens ATCC 27750]
MPDSNIFNIQYICGYVKLLSENVLLKYIYNNEITGYDSFGH